MCYGIRSNILISAVMKILHTLLLIIYFSYGIQSLRAQQLTSSNLPIIVISTNGQVILDEPKRNATMTIYDNPDGSRNQLNWDPPVFVGTIGIELRGQSSQALFPKKSYGVETRDISGNDLDTSILGFPRQSDWVIHGPYSDKSLIRNALSYILAGEIMEYAPRVRMAELVLNNEYQGLIVWTENIKRDKNRVDISKLGPEENEGDNLTGGYILKFDKGDSYEIGWESPYQPLPGRSQRTRFLYHYPKPGDITNQQKSYIRNWITEFENVLMSNNYGDPDKGYEKYMDVQSFVDFIIINEMSKNIDGYRLSSYMYKDKDSKGGKLFMGPVWDFNLAWGNANYCSGSTTYGWELNFNGECPDDFWLNHVWWNRLMIEARFRQTIKDRWIKLRRSTFSTDKIIAKVDSLVSLIGEAQVRNFNKWPVLGKYIWPNDYVGSSYGEEINYLKQWIASRTNWLDGAFGDLTTSSIEIDEDPDISVYPNPSNGYIYIDSKEDLLDIQLFQMDGRKIRVVDLKNQGTIYYPIELAPNQGMIFYRINKKGGGSVTGRLAVIN